MDLTKVESVRRFFVYPQGGTMTDKPETTVEQPLDNMLKAIGETEDEIRVANYIVMWGSPEQRDLEGWMSDFINPDGTKGNYFTPETSFESSYTKTGRLYLDWEHGRDTTVDAPKQDDILGYVDWPTAKADNRGLFVERAIFRHNQYADSLKYLIDAGLIGTSSEAIPSKATMDKNGRIVRWPLKRDALTVTPAEPRMKSENVITALKALSDAGLIKTSLLPQTPEQPIGEAEGAGDAPPSEGMAGEADKSETKNTETNIMEITQEQLQEMIATASKSAADEAVKSVVASLPPTNGGGHIEVTKDEADQDFASPGEFFKAVKNAALYPSAVDVKLRSRKATGLSEGVPSDGGYLLSPSVASGIIERMYATGEILNRVANDPVGPNSNSMLYNAIDETSRVDGSRNGGVLGYWMAEAATKTASKPKFRQMELKLKKVAALCYATDEQLEDTVNLESWLMRSVPNELRFQAEAAIVRGDGAGKPLGILESPCLVSPLRVDANEIDSTDVAVLWSRRWAGVNDYVWLVHPSIFPQLAVMSISNQPVYLPAGGYSAAPYGTIFGKPVIENEYCSTLGTAGDIILASLGQYQTITKGGIKADSSIHVQFTTDETAFRFVFRIDGQPLWDSALTPYQGSSTVSPFVTLSAATAA